MNGTGAFYCVKCNKLEELGQAETLFRTGYFRVIHPLGCCVSCGEKEMAVSGVMSDAMQEMACAEAPYFDNRDYRTEPVSVSRTPSPDFVR
jgi:hypothetical protein